VGKAGIVLSALAGHFAGLTIKLGRRNASNLNRRIATEQLTAPRSRDLIRPSLAGSFTL